jgi:hypothetical protein
LINLGNHIKRGNLKYLTSVKCDGNPKVTPEGKTALRIASLKADKNKGNKKLNAMYNAAKDRDQAQYDGGVEFI